VQVGFVGVVSAQYLLSECAYLMQNKVGRVVDRIFVFQILIQCDSSSNLIVSHVYLKNKFVWLTFFSHANFGWRSKINQNIT
jgi:hypothetical protein